MFGIGVVCYLFLGGMGGGLCIVLGILALMVPDLLVSGCFSSAYRGFFARGYAAAALILLLGSLCLLADSGNYDALKHLFVPRRLTYLTAGAYLLTALIVISVAYSICWRGGSIRALRTLYRCRAILSILLGIAVTLYTGLYLSDLPAVAVWHTPLLPLLFFLSSLSCGLACAPVVAYMAGEWGAFSASLVSLVKVDAAVIALEIAIVALFVAAPFWGSSDSSASLARQVSTWALIGGAVAPAFWVAFVAIGLACPLALELRPGRNRAFGRYAIIAAAVVVGAFVMRYVIVEVGVHPEALIGGA
ncbi:NrfD/PsrC family molybdoenzyme membrane anchor subunit [uncultured Adlercreutzia sp.]|uniref:NrfD/PsrC family molybdoenzyme membrane anchor subunit n=1 Tax=uncultured Adlercreutzia sp. TaxID=875803 RepID=UPI0026F3D619|nr:NrfD/PsrC family molybdoenzyme membrane anchor subunit [uncultured Adlercreutzia sp.]